jgi:hypothetical protein
MGFPIDALSTSVPLLLNWPGTISTCAEFSGKPKKFTIADLRFTISQGDILFTPDAIP